MQAMILAAGMGRRLKELTDNNTKCMIRVNGITLIERLLRQLDARQLAKIILVVGYQGQKLMDYVQTLDITTPIEFVENPDYAETNNIYSLYLAREYLCQDATLLFESDLIFEDEILDLLENDPRPSLAVVDHYQSWMDGTCVTLGQGGVISSMIAGKDFPFSQKAQLYKTVNIYKFSTHFSATHYVPFLEAYIRAQGSNQYYEQVLRVIAMLDHPGLKAMPLSGQKWYEIDDQQDLDIASVMFTPDPETRLHLMQKRYGGYWRFPGMLDFCYLVNPYFPPERLLEEMKSSFEELITRYPSGADVLSLLAAKDFNVPQKQIAVGNGAAELIEVYLRSVSGKVGIIRPTFEEYPNRIPTDRLVVFQSEKAGFAYSAEDLMTFFDKKELSVLILINPDNPSGNAIPKADLIRLAVWCRKRSVTLILDESFADFSQEKDLSCLDASFLSAHPHVIVIKSISKSCGVPGLRLGIMACADTQRIADIRQKLPIWNINSFAEYYLQICEKYKKDYLSSLELFRAERAAFQQALRGIPCLEVFPSEANYFLVRLTGSMTASDLTQSLLCDYNIFVKDLSEKIPSGQYLRLAVRNSHDNRKLLTALYDLLG